MITRKKPLVYKLKPKRKHFSDCDDGKEIEGLPEPAPCPFCDFDEWASIVTVSHYHGWIVDTAARLGSPLN